MKMNDERTGNLKNIPGSFRDPSGSLFIKDGVMYRRINLVYKEHYDQAEQSGLYGSLIKDGLLIPHQEAEVDFGKDENIYKIISPEKILFISYPYEWCFSQLKDAALLTLRVQKRALDFNMTLKDASCFNVQFWRGKPIFIDTLSFEIYKEGDLWWGYRQFCQHFLAPLVLMSYRGPLFSRFLRIFLDGIPLDMASSLLPLRTYLNFGIVSHIHIHAKSQRKFAEKSVLPTVRASRRNLLALLENLERTVKRLALKSKTAEWSDYYEKTNYSTQAFQQKKDIVHGFLKKIAPESVWDMGANIGEFSRIASAEGIDTVSFDNDPIAVEKNYLEMARRGEENLLPLVLDITNPSPGLGWDNKERDSLERRGPVDTLLALALIHHLAISNNLPLKMIAECFSKLCCRLIIEFIPKSDSNVKRLLGTRKNNFSDYHQAAFETEFSRYFSISEKKNIAESERILYLMTKKT